MSDLLTIAVRAHGGLDRWRELTEITAHAHGGGLLWGGKGHEGIFADTHVTIDPRVQRASHDPIGAPGRRTVYTPERVAIEADDGTVLAERHDPRAAFDGHGPGTAWDELHVVYFGGYAIWNYLTLPFVLTYPGVEVAEVEPWEEEPGQVRRRLAAVFPDDIATHSREQTFHFDDTGLLRRHDYVADVVGGNRIAHYTDDYRDFGGIRYPTRRRAYRRSADGRAGGPALVTVDLPEVRVR